MPITDAQGVRPGIIKARRLGQKCPPLNRWFSVTLLPVPVFLIMLFVALPWEFPSAGSHSHRGRESCLRADQHRDSVPETLGATVDGQDRGVSSAIFRPTTLAAMRSVGLRPLSYRLRTELGIAVWH